MANYCRSRVTRLDMPCLQRKTRNIRDRKHHSHIKIYLNYSPSYSLQLLCPRAREMDMTTHRVHLHGVPKQGIIRQQQSQRESAPSLLLDPSHTTPINHFITHPRDRRQHGTALIDILTYYHKRSNRALQYARMPRP